MPELQVRRIAYALGAEVRGVDLRRRLDDATVAAIRSAWLEHLLLCFPDQEMGKDELRTFAERFGELESAASPAKDPNSNIFTLLTEKPVDGKSWYGYKNGQIWHSDQSYTTEPSGAGFLSCKEIPEIGGDTMFANQYMAYDALSSGMRAVVEQLSGIHDNNLRLRAGLSHLTDDKGPEADLRAMRAEHIGRYPLTVQPAVRTHPETRRTSLYVHQRVRRFAGMTEEESRPILDYLVRTAVRYEFTYRHRWHINDLVMWDNRCLLHIALCDYDLQRDPRLMLRCAVKGLPSGHHYTAADDTFDIPTQPVAAMA